MRGWKVLPLSQRAKSVRRGLRGVGMNKRLLNLVIKTYELKGAAYQVMLALAWNSSSTNECSISILDLASAAHLTKQSVIRALHNLTAPDAAAEGRAQAQARGRCRCGWG